MDYYSFAISDTQKIWTLFVIFIKLHLTSELAVKHFRDGNGREREKITDSIRY